MNYSPKPPPIVFPDSAQPSASPVQSSPQDTVKSTTPPLVRLDMNTLALVAVEELPYLPDWLIINALGGEYCGAHNANKAH
ncbi:hypothetical protein ACTXT7_006838 [Hymenolepis weldensis]